MITYAIQKIHIVGMVVSHSSGKERDTPMHRVEYTDLYLLEPGLRAENLMIPTMMMMM